MAPGCTPSLSLIASLGSFITLESGDFDYGSGLVATSVSLMLGVARYLVRFGSWPCGSSLGT